MLTAELSAGFLVVLYVAHRVGFDPEHLAMVPPLDLLTASGRLGEGIAIVLAYILLFAAYELTFFVLLRVAAALRRDAGIERLRSGLSRGRDPYALKKVIWTSLAVAPIGTAIVLLVSPHDASRAIVIGLLLAFTAAQTLRPFTVGDVVRATLRLDEDVQEMTRPGDAIDGPRSSGGDNVSLVPREPNEHGTTSTAGWIDLNGSRPGRK